MENATPPVEGCERSRIVSAMYVLYCKRCATRGEGIPRTYRLLKRC
jgi:hypothetical protein